MLTATQIRRQMDTLNQVFHFARGQYFGNGTPIGTLTDSTGTEFKIDSLIQILSIVRDRGRKGLTIQRYKGLGEMDAEQLYDTTMDPNNRKILKVVLEDVVEADKMFSMLMGDEVGPRRKFIEDHALMVNNLDI